MRHLAIAILSCLGFSPACAQNLQLNDAYHYTLHGTLVTGRGADEFGKPIPFPALRLASPIDFVCTTDDGLCEDEASERELQLSLGEDGWAFYEANVGSPIIASGSLYHSHTGHHMTPVLMSVDVIEATPDLSIPAVDGRYVSNPNSCGMAHDDYLRERDLEATVADGSLRVEGHEFSCTGTSAQPRLGGQQIEADCWGEGENYDISFALAVKTTGELVIDNRALQLCAPSEPAFVPSSMPEEKELTIDVRPPLADLLPYGSREGMDVTLLDITGRGTINARIEAQHSPYNAYRFCAFYVMRPDFPCVEETLSLPLATHIAADCVAGTFSDFYGGRYRFAGKAEAGANVDFVIVDEVTGLTLDGSSASGYYTNLAIYQTLCPPRDGSRPLLSAAEYEREFERLADWQGQSLYDRGGVFSLPAMQFAMKARPQEGRLVWTRLGGKRLVMHGHYGFAAADGAAALVDFARRQIYLCLYDGRRGREVSYRFGTALAEGLDGFGVACPENIDDMLGEYLPLIDEGQSLYVHSWDMDGFNVPRHGIERYKDMIGLGKVIYFDQCSADPDFEPDWFSVFGGNWSQAGHFEGDGLTCQISDSRYSSLDDSLSLETVCSTAGYESDWTANLVERKGGRLTFDGEVVRSCAEHYFAKMEALGDVDEVGEPVPVAATAAIGTMLDWSGHGTSLFRLGDIEASLAVTGPESAITVNLTASQQGKPIFATSLPATHRGFGGIGVYPMEANGAAWLLFASYAGGASCCTEIIGVPLVGEAEVQSIGRFFGDRWVPKDLDGDGLYEFLLDDERFDYNQAGPLGVFLPPEIYAVRNTSFVDVTAELRYRTALQPMIDNMAAHCGGTQGWNMSACLGWAATGARLGSYDSVMQQIEQRIAGADLPVDWQGPKQFAAIAYSIRAQLEEVGYLK